MTNEVFICHSSKDAAIANTVCTTLESKRIQCWIAPRDVLPGAIWGEAVANAIDETHILVLVLSVNSCNSSQVVREVERAASNNVPIIPLRIDNVAISRALGFFVSSRHWLDAQEPPLRKHLLVLADTVKRLLEQEPARHVDVAISSKVTVAIGVNEASAKTAKPIAFCLKCGNRLRPGTGFCNKCGASISDMQGAQVREEKEWEAEKSRKAKEAQEKAERDAKEKAERKAEEVRKAKEDQEKAEQEAKEKAERQAKEKSEGEAKVKAEHEAKEKAVREAEAARPSPQTLICPKCGNILRPGAGFCNKCGTSVSVVEKTEIKEKPEEEPGAVNSYTRSLFCPKCGYALRPGAGFCDKCGASVRRGGEKKI